MPGSSASAVKGCYCPIECYYSLVCFKLEVMVNYCKWLDYIECYYPDAPMIEQCFRDGTNMYQLYHHVGGHFSCLCTIGVTRRAYQAREAS